MFELLNWMLGGGSTGADGQQYVNYIAHPNAPRGFGNPTSALSESTLSNLGTGLNGINSLADSLGGWGDVLSGLGSLYGAYNKFNMANDALDFAKDKFNFSKNFYSAQLNNQIDSYNTALADRARTRSWAETGTTDAYNDWYEKNKLDSFRG